MKTASKTSQQFALLAAFLFVAIATLPTDSRAEPSSMLPTLRIGILAQSPPDADGSYEESDSVILVPVLVAGVLGLLGLGAAGVILRRRRIASLVFLSSMSS